jgi:hypothetical protein
MSEGGTVGWLGVDEQPIAVFSVADQQRPEAGQAVRDFKVGCFQKLSGLIIHGPVWLFSLRDRSLWPCRKALVENPAKFRVRQRATLRWAASNCSLHRISHPLEPNFSAVFFTFLSGPPDSVVILTD